MKRGNRAVRSQPAEMELAEMLVLYFSISMCIRVHGEGGDPPKLPKVMSSRVHRTEKRHIPVQ